MVVVKLFLRFTRSFFGLILVVNMLVQAPNLHAHGVADDRIVNITKRIEAAPEDPSLYIKRGRVQADVKHWHEALSDYRYALKLDPNYHEALFWIGQVHLHKKEWQKAQQALKNYLAAQPKAAAGYEAMAEVMVNTQQWRSAVGYYDQAIANSSQVKPQSFINRARALMQLSPLPLSEIEAGLREGIKAHGNLVSYIDVGFQASWNAKQYANALSWIQQLPDSIGQSPDWMLKKAQTFEQQGDKKSAINTYRLLISKMEQLPKHRRNIPAWRNIREDSQKAIKRLSAS